MRPCRILALAALALAACSSEVELGPAPVTSLIPPPGEFFGSVQVTLQADQPATLFLTTDGSDPHTSAAQALPSPAAVTLTATTTLTFFARNPEGLEEAVRSETYVRAGGTPGTVSGTILAGAVAVGHLVGVGIDGQASQLTALNAPGEVPFLLTDVAPGVHSVFARVDRNDDGVYSPVFDLTSPHERIELAPPHPPSAAAAVEGLRLYLGVSKPDGATLQGEVLFPKPVPGVMVHVTGLEPKDLSGDIRPGQFDLGPDRAFAIATTGVDIRYPFALTNMPSGTYVPTAILTGTTGLSLNILFNLSQQRTLAPGQIAEASFYYGSAMLKGTLRYRPKASKPTDLRAAVAGRSASLAGTQALVVNCPIQKVAGSTLNELEGTFFLEGLRNADKFSFRAFVAKGDEDPMAAALTWAFNGGLPAHLAQRQPDPTSGELVVSLTLEEE